MMDDGFDVNGFRFTDVDPLAYEEEQLAAALAASLAESSAAPSRINDKTVIDIDSSDSDSDSDAAPGSRLFPVHDPPNHTRPAATAPAPASPSPPLSQSVEPDVSLLPKSSMSAFMRERAELERARLQRQKRRRDESESQDELDGPTLSPQARPSASSSSSSARPAPSGTSERPSKIARTTPFSTSQGGSRTPGVFLDGEIRRTPSPFNSNPTFSLPGVIGDINDLEWGILSAMDIDFDWVATAYPPKKPLVIVSDAGRGRDSKFKAAEVNRLTREWANPTPKMSPGPGVMHSKVFVLFYRSGFVRVAISTANLLDFDWWRIENTVWVQDFPLLSSENTNTLGPSTTPTNNNKLAPKFTESLIRMLRGMHVEAGIQTLLDDHVLPADANVSSASLEILLGQYDFSAVKVALVCSIPGTYTGAEMQKVGHTGLMRALRDVGGRCHADKRIALECQGSSIGRYNADWVESFRVSAQSGGYDDWFELKPKQRKELSYPHPDRLKILFPSLPTVNSVGRHCGGSFFFTPSFWDLPTFPRNNFHDSNARTGALLMHTKMILGTFVSEPRTTGKASSSAKETTQKSGIDPSCGGWLYIGSHNFTPSAWGNLSRAKPSGGEPSINMRNFELGLVFPLPADGFEKRANELVCWKRPARPYGSDVPWMQDLHRNT